MLTTSQVKANSSGDTIVEVLIAIVVASAVLVGAFTVANRSSIQIRAAQERSEAQKLTAAIIERIKSDPVTASGMPVDEPRCSDFKTKAISNGAAVPVYGSPLPPVKNDKNSLYNPLCKSANTGVAYYSSVKRINTNTYEAHTRWDRVNGGDRQDLILIYRADR